MSTNQPPQVQIDLLKQQLKDAITAKEATSEGTIPDYLWLNNLRSKLARLELVDRNLSVAVWK